MAGQRAFEDEVITELRAIRESLEMQELILLRVYGDTNTLRREYYKLRDRILPDADDGL